MRFYRYLFDAENAEFVGEVAYRYSEDEDIYLADVIVIAGRRSRGIGRIGLRLLCKAARERGVRVLYDNIALGNPAIALFLSEGFFEELRGILLHFDIFKIMSKLIAFTAGVAIDTAMLAAAVNVHAAGSEN